jgi:hypothetical protein
MCHNACRTGCGGILKQQPGTIQSPNYPLRYPHDHTCRWIIVGPAGTVIQLTWQTFHLEGPSYRGVCRYDKVFVFDNSSVPESDGLMGTWVWVTFSVNWVQSFLYFWTIVTYRTVPKCLKCRTIDPFLSQKFLMKPHNKEETDMFLYLTIRLRWSLWWWKHMHFWNVSVFQWHCGAVSQTAVIFKTYSC